jgi:hypothetical protein
MAKMAAFGHLITSFTTKNLNEFCSLRAPHLGKRNVCIPSRGLS